MAWKRVSKARYWDMLEALPPAVMGGGGFMVGEPCSVKDGSYTFTAFRRVGNAYFESTEPMTIAEFRKICPAAADWACSEERARA